MRAVKAVRLAVTGDEDVPVRRHIARLLDPRVVERESALAAEQAAAAQRDAQEAREEREAAHERERDAARARALEAKLEDEAQRSLLWVFAMAGLAVSAFLAAA